MRVNQVDISLDLEAYSKNQNPARAFWATKHAAKKTWERALMDKFYEVGLPRPIPQTHPRIVPIEVFCIHRRRRRIKEPENWRPFLAEVIGDALIGGHTGRREKARHDGWIYDDTKDYWNFHFDVSDGYGSILTTIRIMWMEGEVQNLVKEEEKRISSELGDDERPVKEHVRHVRRGPIFDANPESRVDHPEHGECVEVRVPEHRRAVRTSSKKNSDREGDTHEEQDRRVA